MDEVLQRNEEALAYAVGERVRMLRNFRSLFQEDLAAQCGFSRQYLSAIERGKKLPNLAQLNKIAEVLKCELRVDLLVLKEDF